MASTFDQDKHHDIFLDSSGKTFQMADGVDAYGFILADAVRTLKGELQLDIDRGIPYQETVWASARNIERWKLLVSTTIQSFEFVVNIESFDATLENGVLTYTINVATDLGDTVITNAA